MLRTRPKPLSMAFYKSAIPILSHLIAAWFVVAFMLIVGKFSRDTFCAANKIIKGDFVSFLALHFKE